MHQNVLKNYLKNIDYKIDEIWKSYYEEQGSQIKVNKKELDKGINVINQLFKKKLELKSVNFHETLKNAIY